MARIIVCDRCGKTTQMDRMYIYLRKCKRVRLDIEESMIVEERKHLCGDCAKEFRSWLKAKPKEQ